jgi:hypothetical protein
MPSKQQLDRRCPGGFSPSWYPPGCGGWQRWCRCTTKKLSRSPWSRKTGSGDQLLGGGLPFENGDDGLLLIKELTGGQDATTRGGGLLLGSFDSDDQGVEPLLEDLGVGGRKGYDNP